VGKLKLKSKHRLLCGDSTSEADVARLMDGEKIESVVTDPPYGMDFQSNFRKVKHRKIDGDKDETILASVCKMDAVFSKYIFCRWDNLASLPKPKSVVVWIKSNSSMGDLKHEHSRCSELVLFYNGNDHRWKDGRPRDFINEKRTTNPLHPTQKPVELIAEIVGWCVGSILDLFLGSGSTLIACEQLNRKCYGMEIDPLYCDVIVKRWENLTGEKAVCNG
jgi:site-specific DNA-methyltransferase (adenine-specific)